MLSRMIMPFGDTATHNTDEQPRSLFNGYFCLRNLQLFVFSDPYFWFRQTIPAKQ